MTVHGLRHHKKASTRSASRPRRPRMGPRWLYTDSETALDAPMKAQRLRESSPASPWETHILPKNKEN
eukprot:8414456-Pyramimonas_sp.AAC.1